MAGATVEWEVENADDEAALRGRLSALRSAGNGNVKVMWNSTLAKFTLVYLKAV